MCVVKGQSQAKDLNLLISVPELSYSTSLICLSRFSLYSYCVILSNYCSLKNSEK